MKEIKIVFLSSVDENLDPVKDFERHTFDLYIDGKKEEGVRGVALDIKQQEADCSVWKSGLKIEKYFDPPM